MLWYSFPYYPLKLWWEKNKLSFKYKLKSLEKITSESFKRFKWKKKQNCVKFKNLVLSLFIKKKFKYLSTKI